MRMRICARAVTAADNWLRDDASCVRCLGCRSIICGRLAVRLLLGLCDNALAAIGVAQAPGIMVDWPTGKILGAVCGSLCDAVSIFCRCNLVADNAARKRA